jgi:hypothetical protein
MKNEPNDATSLEHRADVNPNDIVEKCWNDLLLLPGEAISLSEIYAKAEKLIQYCRVATREEGIERLKAQVEISERSASAELAADPSNLDRKRVHAALAGALAGFVYPLGRSPRDLNRMAF